MPREAYVNGRYVPHGEAAIHIEDRGFQFADGVYEVVAVRGGRLVDEEGHLARLARSLGELRIDWPVSPAVLKQILRRLVRRNGVRDGMVYFQITRGSAPRDFKFPKHAQPTLVVTTRRADLEPPAAETGVPVITIPDIRWKRRDIKTVGMTAQVLGKQAAADAGAFEAWQVDDDGLVTEGCSSNAWIVTPDRRLVTRHANRDILNGVTRLSILSLAARDGYVFEERPFTVDEAKSAAEAFLSSATTFVMPVVSIDGTMLGDGRPGPLSWALRRAYLDHAAGAGASS